MMKNAWVVCAMSWVLATNAASAAETGGTVEISVDLYSGKTANCVAELRPDGARHDVAIHAAVSVDKKAQNAEEPEAKTLTFGVTPVGAASETSLKRDKKPHQNIELTGFAGSLGDLEGAVFSVRTTGGRRVCEAIVKASAGLPPTAGGESRACEKKLAQLSIDSEKYIAKHSDASTHEEPEGWRTGRTLVVSHLPNGEIQATRTNRVPADVSERDTLRLVAVVPPDASVDFEVKECEAAPWYRLLHVEGAAPAIKGQVKKPGGAEEEEPREVWYGKDLKCATRLKYAITVKVPDCSPKTVEHTVETQAVYDFFLGAGFGFDAGEPASFSTEKRLKSDNTTENLLVRKNDRTGFKSVITLSSFPFGWNLKRWRWWDTPAPFIAIDPSRLDKGAIAGINWTHSSGVGLLTGVSVFKTKELSAPVGLKPGSVVPNGVDVSTRDTFNSDSVGLFIGANFTTDVLQQFLKAAGGALAGGSGSGKPEPKGTGSDGGTGETDAKKKKDAHTSE